MKNKKSILIRAVVIAIAALLLPVMIQAGSLEPSGPPGPTTQIPPAWSQTIAGAERFELVLSGAGVLDKETGLVWEQSPAPSTYSWVSAQTHCYQLEVGGRKGWHLPTIEQLASLVDTTNSNPALPTGHLFTNVQSYGYWSATTYANLTTLAWAVGFVIGDVGYNDKTFSYYVWCVRGGQSYDAY